MNLLASVAVVTHLIANGMAEAEWACNDEGCTIDLLQHCKDPTKAQTNNTQCSHNHFEVLNQPNETSCNQNVHQHRESTVIFRPPAYFDSWARLVFKESVTISRNACVYIRNSYGRIYFRRFHVDEGGTLAFKAVVANGLGPSDIRVGMNAKVYVNDEDFWSRRELRSPLAWNKIPMPFSSLDAKDSSITVIKASSLKSLTIGSKATVELTEIGVELTQIGDLVHAGNIIIGNGSTFVTSQFKMGFKSITTLDRSELRVEKSNWNERVDGSVDAIKVNEAAKLFVKGNRIKINGEDIDVGANGKLSIGSNDENSELQFNFMKIASRADLEIEVAGAGVVLGDLTVDEDGQCTFSGHLLNTNVNTVHVSKGGLLRTMGNKIKLQGKNIDVGSYGELTMESYNHDSSVRFESVVIENRATLVLRVTGNVANDLGNLTVGSNTWCTAYANAVKTNGTLLLQGDIETSGYRCFNVTEKVIHRVTKIEVVKLVPVKPEPHQDYANNTNTSTCTKDEVLAILASENTQAVSIPIIAATTVVVYLVVLTLGSMTVVFSYLHFKGQKEIRGLKKKLANANPRPIKA